MQLTHMNDRVGAVAALDAARGPASMGGVPDADPHGSEADRAIEMICRVHGSALFSYLMRLTRGDRQMAEDLLQETLLRAWRNIDRLRAEPASLRPWLFTVARNHTIDVIRARQARPTEVGMRDTARIPAHSDPVEQLLISTTVRQALAGLTPGHRAVVMELYFRGATMAEAAARLGLALGTVKSRAHYALRALRASIGPFDT